MGIFDFLKKKDEGTAVAAENPETRESEGRQMLRRIRAHLNEDFRNNQESEEDIKAFMLILEKEVGKYVERKRQAQQQEDAVVLCFRGPYESLRLYSAAGQ